MQNGSLCDLRDRCCDGIRARDLSFSNCAALLHGGRIEQFGSPKDLVTDPQTAFVATFVGTPPANLIPVSNGIFWDKWSDGELEGQSGSAMFRPEELELAAAPSARTLTLDFAEASPMAGRFMVTGVRNGLRLTAIVDQLPDLTVGDEVHFQLPQNPSGFFTDEGGRV